MGQAAASRSPNPGKFAGEGLQRRYREVRALSEYLVTPLSEADAALQSMADASPAKWHLAHTTWFFETFLLRRHLPEQAGFAAGWPFLFNSYYEAEGPRLARDRRGMLSRPSLADVLVYRAHVDAAIQPLLDRPECAPLLELGLAHEQQHQELLLTDIKHALFQNPLEPALWPAPATGDARLVKAEPTPPEWWSHPGGIVEIGHNGPGFAFDCEGPRHRVLLQPFELARNLVTVHEWQAFIADGGYRTPSLWLSDGWAWVQRERVDAPLYWCGDDHFTYAGRLPRDPAAPVAHLSYYEADAYACWTGARLPTEFEWETIAHGADPAAGNQLDPGPSPRPRGSDELFGDCWQWTRSAFLPYPRFQATAGAVGEYNGKFMAGQFVLKGASCATPRGHSRASYRNFFYPHQRWQITGLRLARDA